jgi:hypothetical protein
MNKLCFTCPDVVMTYFLRYQPMEIEGNANWCLWTICYDMIQKQEMYPPQNQTWQHLDFSDFTTDNEDSNDDSDDTLF